MTTAAALLTRVGLRTGRTTATNFSTIVYSAFDDFLQHHAGRIHNFREMMTTDTISVTAGAYNFAMPTSTLSGFSSTVKDIISAKFVSGSITYGFTVKTPKWLDEHYPDRTRTSATTGFPAIGARIGGNFQIQAPASQAGSLVFQTSHLPASIQGGSNPIPSLDLALVCYACYEVWDSLEMSAEADRMLQRAMGLLAVAIEDDSRDPAVDIRATPRSFDPSLSGSILDSCVGYDGSAYYDARLGD
jgi:hypothetical protein